MTRVLSHRWPFLPLGMERTHVTHALIGADQKIPDGLIKITFLGRLKLQLG